MVESQVGCPWYSDISDTANWPPELGQVESEPDQEQPISTNEE